MKSGSLWSPACPVRLQHKVASVLPSAASTQILPPLSSCKIFDQNGMCQKRTDVHLFCNFSDSRMMVLHHPSIDFGNDLVILACWRPAEPLLIINRCVAIFKLAVSLLNLCDAHSIIIESSHPVCGKIWCSSAVSLFSLQWKSEESTKHYLTQMLLAIN